MSETLAQIGYLTLFKRGNGASPEVFTTVAEVVNIDGFGSAAQELEATHMESPNRFIERVPGMKDGQVMTVTLNFTNVASQAVLKTDYDAGLVKHYELNFPGTLPDYDLTCAPISWNILGIQPNGILQVAAGFRLNNFTQGG